MVGIDSDDGYLAQARFAASAAKSRSNIDACRCTTSPSSASASTSSSSWVCSITCAILSWRWSFSTITSVGETLVFQSMLRGDLTLPSLRDDYPITDERVFDESNYPRIHFVEKPLRGRPDQLVDPQSRLCGSHAAQRRVRDCRPSGRGGLHLSPARSAREHRSLIHNEEVRS